MGKKWNSDDYATAAFQATVVGAALAAIGVVHIAKRVGQNRGTLPTARYGADPQAGGGGYFSDCSL